MTRAYDAALLARASDTLGRMLDFSSRSLHYDVRTMMELFCSSGLSALFEAGSIRVTAGMSGTELAYETLIRSGISFERVLPRHTGGYSPEYWYGCALARVQWESCLPFAAIIKDFSSQDFAAEYSRKRTAYLESLPLDISDADRLSGLRAFGEDHASKAAEAELAKLAAGSELSPGKRLKKNRIRCGLSQSALAAAAGIPVRTVQQYEQDQKDLRKARAEYLVALARALHCDPSSLIS